MSTKYKVLIYATVLVTAFAVGRYTTPVKIKIVEKIVEVEKKTEDKKTNTDTSRDKHKKVTTIVIEHPDGTKETRTEVSEDTTTDRKSQSDSHSTDDKTTTVDKETEKTRGDSKVTIAAMAGVSNPFGSPSTVYGGSVYKPVLGPIGVGVWGLSNSTFGAYIGLSF